MVFDSRDTKKFGANNCTRVGDSPGPAGPLVELDAVEGDEGADTGLGGDEFELLQLGQRAADGAAADLVLQGELVLAGEPFAVGEAPRADQVGEIADQVLLLAAHVAVHVHTCTPV